MNAHPGGEEQTRRLLRLAELKSGARVLDLGAGAGESVALLRALGFEARGLDLQPRGEGVERGDLLAAPFPDASFDAILSECAFFASGDQGRALAEAHRLLRPGGTLLLSDVFFTPPEGLLAAAGFILLHDEDVTDLWREYYIDALWRGEQPCCAPPKGKCRYHLLIAGKGN